MVKARILCTTASYQPAQEHSRLYEISAVGQEQKKRENRRSQRTNRPTQHLIQWYAPYLSFKATKQIKIKASDRGKRPIAARLEARTEAAASLQVLEMVVENASG